MAFVNDCNIILFLKAQTLELYIKGVEGVQKIDLPNSVVKHLEVIDPAKINDIIVSFIAKTRLDKQNAIMLLSDEVVFEKLFTRDTPEKEQNLIDNFLDKVPLSKSDLINKIIPQGDSIFVFATNKNLFKTVIDSFEMNNWKIKIVTASSVFGKFSSLNSEIVSKILTKNNLLEKSNFLDELNKQSEVAMNTDTSKNEVYSHPLTLKQYLMIIIALVFLVGAIIYALLNLDIIKNPLSSNQINSVTTKNNEDIVLPSQDSKTNIVESTSSDIVSEGSESAVLKKEDLQIEILNGSGISGQAGKVKDLLSVAGFKNFKLGNNNSILNINTKVNFNSHVSQVNQKEIVDLVKQLFNSVDQQQISIQDFDVIIITGQ